MNAAIDHAAELRGSEEIIRDELSIWPLDLKRVLLASLLAECGAELPPLKPLTAAQRDVLAFVCEHIDRIGFPPTNREILRRFGWTSTNAVADHLKRIEKKGYIERLRVGGGTNFQSRGIRVLRRPS